MRRAVVKRLKQLGYDVESHPKIMRKTPGFATRRLYVKPEQMATFFELGRIRQQKEIDRLCLPSAVPKIQWPCNPHCPSVLNALGNLCLFLPFSLKVTLTYSGGNWKLQFSKRHIIPPLKVEE